MPPGAWKSELNEAQRRAVEHSGGPLIVLAGPGTGKTRVIISRVRRLIEEGTPPESVLALTFSVKAAEEMRSRLTEALGPRVAERVQASTFHKFGSDIVRRFGDWLGLRRERVFMDSAQARRLLRQLIFDHNLFEDRAAAGRESAIDGVVAFISACRDAGKTTGDALAHAERWSAEIERNEKGLTGDDLVADRERCRRFAEHARLFDLYDRACVDQGLMTFDDCITLPLRIFTEKPASASIVRQEIRHVLVDEFQDVNRSQIELLRHVAPPRGEAGRPADLCVVGDDDQSIYAFRGADNRAFERFAETWPDHETVALTVDYRNPPAVIAAANAVISACDHRFAPDKRIEPPTGRRDRGRVEGVILDDDEQAGIVVAAMIALDRRANPDRAFGEYAVIAQQNKQAEAAAAELLLQGIPASIRRRARPLDDNGVQDLLAWLRLLAEPGRPGEVAAARRLLSRPPYFVNADVMNEWCAEYHRSRPFGGADDRPPFTAWVRERAGGEAAVERFLSLLGEFRRAALAERADRLVFHVIREADLAHSEMLDPEARAARVSALVAALRFVRSRQPYLDEPGDIAAFWRYYNDLNDDEKAFLSPSDERLEATEEDAFDPDAVQVMTAHKAKGLEFDTVFLLHCRPGGFPPKKRSAGEREQARPLPVEFSGQHRDDEEDESRRLFYVACTRSARRLVLLAERRKTRSKSVDYFNELTDDPSVELATLEAADILKEAGLEPRGASAVLREASAADRRREGLIRVESNRARQQAYAALHDAASGVLDAGALAGVGRRLADAAGALHALEHLRSRGELPAEAPESWRERLEALLSRIADEAGTPLVRPMTPPLKLSYSVIADYEACPRCFYAGHVLNLPEEESDALMFGTIVHEALERFYAAVRDAENDGRSPPGIDALRRIGEEALRNRWPRSRPHDRAFHDRLLAQLRLAHEILHDPRSNILHLETMVRFSYRDPRNSGLSHEFSAKIDRVEQAPDGSIRIIDYKTGQATKKLREPERDDLQLCVYAMALPALFARSADAGHGPAPAHSFEPAAGSAEYWILSTGERVRIALADLDVPAAIRRIDAAIVGMLEGRFPRGSSKTCSGLCALLEDE